jgi:SAM-dependent methyltransferase
VGADAAHDAPPAAPRDVADATAPRTPRAFAGLLRPVPVAQRPLQLRSVATMGQYRRPYALTAQFLGAAQQVLDWGCGNGHFSRFLLAQDRHVTGYSYEPPPALLAAEPRFTYVPGTVGEPVRLPFADASFDAVFSVGVLEHVHELGGTQEASLHELVRVLRPGGRLFVFHLPNRGSWIEAAARQSRRWRPSSTVHVHSKLFSTNEVTALFGAAPLRELARERYAVLPRNSLARLPAFLRDGRAPCAMIDALDAAGAALLPGLCQNWAVVAERQD